MPEFIISADNPAVFPDSECRVRFAVSPNLSLYAVTGDANIPIIAQRQPKKLPNPI